MTVLTSYSITKFLPERLALLDHTRVPKHIAIIPDGNRRWANSQKKTREEGHRKGADIILDIVKAARDLGVKYVTIFTFSTENWERPKDEVAALMILLQHYLISQREPMLENGVRLESIGDLTAFPKSIQEELKLTKEITKKSDAITLILALNYGGRNDIKRAFQKIINDGHKEVTEELISNYLDTSNIPDPDLLIRTSGEHRFSNFLLWQLSYAEFYTTKTFWPDFTPNELLEATLDFQKRERRLGKK